MADTKPVTSDAATVILVRDSGDGLETLMLRRNSKLDFAGGMWVFPGGRVDPADREGLAHDDELGAARRAAVREVLEETGLSVQEDDLLPFSHWTPPPVAPRRFLTWFFIAKAPEGVFAIDRGEIHAGDWMRPSDAMRRRNSLEIELLPPTWVTLERLAGYAEVVAALEDTRGREPERFATRISIVDRGGVALFHGDAGYETSDAAVVGSRHRLWMLADGWRYERT
jgi:8-oxo-dGTP pyrophosphatase MutT (NUDIX family)